MNQDFSDIQQETYVKVIKLQRYCGNFKSDFVGSEKLLSYTQNDRLGLSFVMGENRVWVGGRLVTMI